MTSVSKNVYIDKLDDINKYVHKCNNTYHSTIKMKAVDVKSSAHINSREELNDEDLKSKIGSIIRISKYQNIFTKGYVPNQSEEVFVIKKVKKHCTMVKCYQCSSSRRDCKNFFEKEVQKTNQKEYRVEKVIKRKCNKLHGERKGYDSSFNSWINKKDII